MTSGIFFDKLGNETGSAMNYFKRAIQAVLYDKYQLNVPGVAKS